MSEEIGDLYWECEDCGYLLSHDEVLQRIAKNIEVKLHECKCGGKFPDPAKKRVPPGTLLVSAADEEEIK